MRLGLRVAAFEDDGTGIGVRFDDDSTGRYDLLVEADGIYSETRRHAFFRRRRRLVSLARVAGAPSRRRPQGVDRTEMFFGGPVKLGFNPLSEHACIFLRCGACARQSPFRG